MVINKDDRRVKRTRRLLKQGLAELLRQKHFSDISARDITEKMDLNKATFYLHYKNTYELLQDLETDLLEQAQEMIDRYEYDETEDSMRKFFEPLLDFVVENRSVCEALFVNNASSDFTGRVVEFIYKNGTEIMKKRFPKISVEDADYVLSFVAFGLIGLLRRWFEKEMSIPKEKLLNIADEMLAGINYQLLNPNR
ncbi:MAG: TetR/AcrR family transcriptional regulator [Anaerovoracaceae bacterium]